MADFMHPDRVVVGSDPGDEEAAAAVAALYEPLGGTILHTDVASAEMIKLASNAFLATKISFINEIANVCEEVGADVGEVANGMGLDERIGPSFLRAGIGYGGSCFPKDVSALKMLAGNTGYHFQLLNAVIEVNELQKRRVVGKLEKYLGSLIGKRVALLGLAFKPDTDDMREASSLVLAARLQGEGATVVAYDPVACGPGREMLDSVEMAASAQAALEGADAAVLVTEWPEFAALDWAAAAAKMARPLVVDGRNFLDPGRLRAAGFDYEGIGRPQVTPVSATMRVDAGDRSGRRRRDAPASAHRDDPEAGPDPGRPALPRLHGRVAGRARRHRGGAGLRLPARSAARGARRRRVGGGPAQLRDRARASRHRRGDPLCRRLARRAPRGPLPRPQRRRPHRSRPDGAAGGARAASGRRRRWRSTRSRTPPPTGWSAATPTAAVLEFLEKTGEEVPGEINAGAYVLERSVLDLIPPGREVSIEREVFPRLVGAGLCALPLDGYWMDIGTPERYLQASWDILERRVHTGVRATAPGLLLGAGAEIADGAVIGPRAVISAGCSVAAGAEVRDSVLLDGCSVGAGARISGSILSSGVTVAAGATPGRRGCRSG